MNRKLLLVAQDSISKYQSEVVEEDTQDCANFLLSLKNNRNVTPEPSPSVAEHRVTSLSAPFKISVAISAYDSDDNSPSLMDEHAEMTFQHLLDFGDSLVAMSDRHLVPDALFVAMAQMKVVNLTESDRVGCYRNRAIGFVGLGCKHCGGQPGFGKYFPESVRSLAQTTTSQTILKHIGSKCRFCPQEIRQAVNRLQHQQAIKEAAIAGRPRYGSRKVFFQRIWGRLHNEPIPEYSGTIPTNTGRDVLPPDVNFICDGAAAPPVEGSLTTSLLVATAPDKQAPPVEREADDASTGSMDKEQASEDLNFSDHTGKKCRFGGLPTKKNQMKRKQLADNEKSTGSTPKRPCDYKVGGPSTFP